MMFVCDDCLSRKFMNNPSGFTSGGNCELCGYLMNCSDIPSKFLIDRPKDYRYYGVIFFSGNDMTYGVYTQHEKTFYHRENRFSPINETSLDLSDPLTHLGYTHQRFGQLDSIFDMDDRLKWLQGNEPFLSIVRVMESTIEELRMND